MPQFLSLDECFIPEQIFELELLRGDNKEDVRQKTCAIAVLGLMAM